MGRRAWLRLQPHRQTAWKRRINSLAVEQELDAHTISAVLAIRHGRHYSAKTVARWLSTSRSARSYYPPADIIPALADALGTTTGHLRAPL